MTKSLSMNYDSRVPWGDPRLPERFWNKVVPEPNSGCLLWIGTAPSDYGQIQWWVNGRFRRVGVHTLTVVASGRRIPPGTVVDHKCETKICVNADHLDVVTVAENARRHFARHPITHCPSGHELAIVGVYRFGAKRKCRICHGAQVRAGRLA